MKNALALFLGAAIALPFAVPQAAHAADQPKPLGTFKGWTAATYGTGPDIVCYAFASSKQAKGAKTPPAMLTVAERTKFRDEISLSQGVTYVKNQDVIVKVGGAALKFFTKDNMAYALKGPATVKAFLGGASAVASTGKGAKAVSDTFSLDGFGDAYKAIVKACPPSGRKAKS